MEYLVQFKDFLTTTARIDLKTIALEYTRGISGSKEGAILILKCEEVLNGLMSLVTDESQLVQKEAIQSLINVSAEEEGALSIISLNPIAIIITNLLNILLDSSQKNADLACMLLCNLTRSPETLSKCVSVVLPKLPQLLDAFTNTKFNTVGCHLNYLGPLFSNLSVNEGVQKWLFEYKAENMTVAIMRIATFSHYKSSLLRRGGAVGTIKNVCFDVARHSYLLETEILQYLLLPLAGNEEYADDEMDCLPPSLQYLPPETQREEDPDIRILLLETLNRLCAKRPGREFLRENGVYYILRELHKWEKDRKALLACENVVDILIRKEEEIDLEDITSVEVPEEYSEKFIKGDENFINDK